MKRSMLSITQLSQCINVGQRPKLRFRSKGIGGALETPYFSFEFRAVRRAIVACARTGHRLWLDPKAANGDFIECVGFLRPPSLSGESSGPGLGSLPTSISSGSRRNSRR